ncbi:YgfZ/GcvT domain-containing protein [Microbacterium dauci]|uniref:Glycine cleavage T C-terminal barrel domain-containing protein n=1 Tax=Microbacterium dauci TaxID=3048008 RepID=A0ABT6ZFN5_9MICO|nr:glycine cleavage T C-terminal barrel domain-containing protein [Microbacterium sp. LX3-4]MDJ1114965.1 glycine cleavage T C-terminal barrel domain-containing protein [Microbacterium sp. LX3-4]
MGDDGVLQHLGEPVREQRDLAAGRALAPLADRAVLTVAGEDRLSWLDSITSQALTSLAPGVGTELLVLDPQGHVEYAASVVDDGERTWLIVDRDRAAGLLTWLQRMRFRLRVDPQAATDYAVVAGTVDATAHLPAAVTWRDPWPAVSPGGWGYAAVTPHPGEDRDWTEAIVPVSALETLVEAAAAGTQPLAGALAAEALRIAAWRPRASAEADGRTLPHEVDWLRTAVHLEKGCYRGQETVAKVHNLGHPPRRLVSLQLDGSDAELPAPGAAVRRDGVDVGAVTSVARHHDEGPIALAIIKRTVPVDAALTVEVDGGEVAAAQEVIVPPEAGRAASVPRLPRLSQRR